MKTYTIVAALSLAAAAAFPVSSFAQEATYELPQPVQSSVTRASVQADLARARADGSVITVGEAGSPERTFVAQKTRAEVRAEVLAAVASGELRALNREPYGAEGGVVPARRAVVAPVLTAAAK